MRGGNVVVSNGPLVEVAVDTSKTTATASASFYRPLERLDIICIHASPKMIQEELS